MAKRHDDIGRAFISGNLDHILLSSLSSKAKHGYALIDEIREDHRVYLGPSTVYPALKWLEKRGLIKSHWDLESKRPRKVYMLTAKGKQMVRHQRMAIHQILRKMEAKENAA